MSMTYNQARQVIARRKVRLGSLIDAVNRKRWRVSEKIMQKAAYHEELQMLDMAEAALRKAEKEALKRVAA